MNFSNYSEAYQLLSALPGAVVIKNKESIYTGGNQKVIELVGYSSLDNFIGITDYDLKCQAAEFAPSFIQQDQAIFESGVSQENLDICRYADDRLHIFLSQKALLKNDQSNEDLLVAYMVELDGSILAKVFNLLYANFSIKKNAEDLAGSYQLNKLSQNYHLSSREEETLFFLLRGWTGKKIAKRFSISPKTVETYVASMKRKMNCHNRTQLIEKAMSDGFLFNIPKSMIFAN